MNKRLYGIILSLLLCLCLGGCGNLKGTSTGNSSLEQDFQTEEQEVFDTDDFLEFDESRLVKRDEESKEDSSISNGDTLEVHYIDIGQGDSILIKQGGEAMLIDAGNNSKGTAVWSYLRSLDIGKLTYVIGTHPDADHIGGLDVIMYKFDCGNIFMPACERDTKTYEEVVDTAKARNQKINVPSQGDIYALGSASFQILTDTGKDYGENTNDYSIALRLTFGDTSFLFTGDAEEAAEQDMLASGLTLASDVYKAAHHGADTANTESFLKAVSPTYCVISCGKDNSYGHPRAGFLNNLRGMGVSVFRTDEQGTIVAVSDGKKVTFNAGPSTSWKAGEPVGSGEGNNEDKEENGASKEGGSGNSVTEGQYVLNTNTGKFHRPDCSSVKKMADKNKRTTDKTREELIEEGYEPCKNCNP